MSETNAELVLALTEANTKYISIGKNMFLTSNGKTENCRKGMKGEYCKRHQGGSVNIKNLNNLRTLEQHITRSQEKLSPFEKGFIWLYSILNKMPIEQAQEHYVQSTGLHTFLGTGMPAEAEVKGLQKTLLKLINTQSDTSKLSTLRNLVKRMTLGQGFTVAGFHAIKDLTRESLTKLKVGIAGLGLAGTLTLTGCAGAVPSPNATTSQITEDNANNNNLSTDEGQTVAGTTQSGLTIVPIGLTTDDLGAYTRSGFKAPDVSVIKNQGVPAGDLASAFDFYSNFVSTEVMDSIALDNPNAWDKWKTEVAPKYLASQYLDEILKAGNEDSSADIIMTNRSNKDTPQAYIPTLIRDGKPRAFNKEISEISATPLDGGGIYIQAMVGELLIMDDASSIRFLDTQTESDTANLIPAYTDGKPQVLKVTGLVGLTMVKDGSVWKIAGFNNSFTSNQEGIFDSATPEILALRK